ncbi:hypothetical protein [Nonomuraea roseoviolacea]|uniref:Glycosyltransferase RgtA/B/C/D-like domain-containing protein n=1 Tax=Nonomuraea roseoviolacea subsp. carminata TaxID=160689 RepID=A0ABT1K581_9ACTN|nr:hypothetical protein [Nonomuraea roseoviolacea]MCP2349170.1 hypothetical protein [Nonomuraea roseoviolacea subsp. carminata]
MEYVIIAAAAVAVIVLVNTQVDAPTARRVLPVVLVAFAARLVVHVAVMRSGVLDYGGDNLAYEARAAQIVELWKLDGFAFVTADDRPYLGSAAVPCNVFALVMYLCGGPAPLACTAVVALLACALCVVVYRIARLVGADERAAFRLLVVTAFMPAFVLHTSDTFKDGFNAFLVVACVGIAVSVARRFRVAVLLQAVPLLWCLWHVRPYMVFVSVVPLVCGVIASRSRFSVNKLVAFSGLLVVGILFAGGVYDDTPLEVAERQLDRGQSEAVIRANAESGSGVVFDDGGNRWDDLGTKIVYTVLSPFPWAAGSLSMQLGKIDVLIWYVMLGAAVRGGCRMWREDRRTLLVFLLFIVPSTVAYATTMANVGLIFRQRMPIVMVTSLLAAVAWTRTGREEPTRPRPRHGRPGLLPAGARPGPAGARAASAQPPDVPGS